MGMALLKRTRTVIAAAKSPALKIPVAMPKRANIKKMPSATIPTKIAARIANTHLRTLSVGLVRANATRRSAVLGMTASARRTTKLQMATIVEMTGKV